MYFNLFFYVLLLAAGLMLRIVPVIRPGFRRRHTSSLLLGLNLLLIGLFFAESSAWFLPPLGIALAGVVLIPAIAPGHARTAASLAIAAELAFFAVVKLPLSFRAFPVGISFVLFLCIGALIDRRRGRLEGERVTATEFLAAATFAPLLVAGPFIGLRELRARMRDPGPLTPETDREATLLFVNGFFKKVIANLLFLYASLGELSPKDHRFPLLTVLSLPAFFYADFSGCSDMARGVALFLGIRIPPNFRLPYLARSFAAFWQRWHVSLGEWLRDYLHGPLFLVHLPRLIRSHRLRVAVIPYLALAITLLAINLWHGLSPKFLVLGLVTAAVAVLPFNRMPDLLARAATLSCIFLYQLAFWSQDLGSAWRFAAAMAADAGRSLASAGFYAGALPLLAALAVPHWIDSRILGAGTVPGGGRPVVFQLALAVILTGCILLYVPGVDFVYSRF